MSASLSSFFHSSSGIISAACRSGLYFKIYFIPPLDCLVLKLYNHIKGR
nr:MAG TPA: hypothetical protein [Caudoviricetes sp.]